MSSFRRTSGGVTARFAKPEAIVIRDLVAQVIELVTDAAPGAAAAAPMPGQADAAGVGDPPLRPGEGDVPDAEALEAMVGMTGSAAVPDDPVLARLLPSAYTDDDDAAGEFRRFTESGLRAAKVDAARTLLASLPSSGGRVRLTRDQAEAWLRSLNDVRLALGVRLGVTDEFDGLSENARPDDPRYAYIQIYRWLAYIQGSLVAALS